MENVTSQLILTGYMITSKNLSPRYSFKRRSVHKLYTTTAGNDLIGLQCIRNTHIDSVDLKFRVNGGTT